MKQVHTVQRLVLAGVLGSVALSHHSPVQSIVTVSSPAINCGDPDTPTNGQRSLSSTTYNSVVTYTCDVGYTLQGANSRTCQSDGLWSESVPQCLGTFVCRFDFLFYLISMDGQEVYLSVCIF